MNAKATNDASFASNDPLAGWAVGELASLGILAVAADAPLDEVAWLMANNRVHAVVIADLPDSPVVSDSDLIAATLSGEFATLRARDVAGTEAVSITADAPLERAAQLLAEHGVSHLIVRDEEGRPNGVLSSLDVARAISTPRD